MFQDRSEAGQRLADQLLAYRNDPDVVVVGLPRGGVPVAREVATMLGAPMDVIVVRKLGVPFQPELAMGAIGEDGVRYINEDLVRRTGVTETELAAVEQREQAELEWRSHRFRTGRPGVALDGRIVIVVDDGIATGSTARAACRVARAAGAQRVVLAVPVAPSDWAERLHDVADEYVAVETHWHFGSIGLFYSDFSQTSEDEVIECLRSVAEQRSSTVPDGSKPASMHSDDVMIDVGGAELEGRLRVPEEAVGLVVFAHGTGSSRHSSRNRSVASILNDGGIATLLLDLLSVKEEASHENVFDVALLGDRLTATQNWLQQQPSVAHLPVGLFGASTGAAAALWSAAEPTSNVAAIVARGGRPELAGLRLASVRAPTLLIVGSHDTRVLALNQEVQGQLRSEAKLLTVPGATHLFEEPGALAVVAELARDWFLDHFGNGGALRSGEAPALI